MQEKVITFRFAGETPDAVIDQAVASACFICDYHRCPPPIVTGGEPQLTAAQLPTLEATEQLIAEASDVHAD